MVSFVLCLLPALLATTGAQTTPSVSLTCTVCAGLSESCTTAVGTCQDNKATGGCISVAEDITLDGTRTRFFYKECLISYKSDIKVPISFTVGNGKYLRLNSTRCNDTDNCNSAVLGVPQGSTAANGFQCPTCLSLNYTPCNVTITPCTGEENYCMDFIGYMEKGSDISLFQAKGCASASTREITVPATLTSVVSTYVFLMGTSVPAEKIPIKPPPTTATNTNTLPVSPSSTSTTLPKTTPRGASPALGKFSFALYLPGLTGLLLVKLFS